MGELSFATRARQIGSSDAIDIMGDANDWLHLYRMKTDEEYHARKRQEISSSLMVKVGNTLEPMHLMELGQRLGTVIEVLPGEQRIAHSDEAWLVDRPDGYVRDVMVDGIVRYGRSPVEVKACGGWQVAHERLTHYWPQIQHHNLVNGSAGCLFSMLIGTTTLHFCYAERDTAFIAEYLDRARRFVNQHLSPRIAPKPESVAAARYVVPSGLVPVVYDSDDMEPADRTAWRRLRDRYVAWQMARDDLEAESAKLKAEATERMRKLVDPRQVRIGDWRCSLTKAGVIQWRDLSKSEEE